MIYQSGSFDFMGYVSCNLCGADSYTVVFPKGKAQLHQIVRCKQCTLMYANPQESVDCETVNLQDAPRVYRPEEHWQYFQKQHVQIPDNLRALAVLDELVPQRGKLLEVGSYLGIFLDRIREDGWTVVGLEPFRAAADYARAQYGVPVIDGTLPQPNLPAASFDAAIMLHVIEHMPDPADSLRELRRLLRKDGVLVIETPRYDSLTFKLLRHRERSVSACDGHIYFFTVPTLRRMVQQAGFAVERVDLVGRTLTLQRLLTNIAIISKSAAVRRVFDQIGPALQAERLRFHINARDMQRIYCRAI